MTDIRIRDEGTVVVFTPVTQEGTDWLHEQLLTEPWQWQGDNLVLDHHLAQGVRDLLMMDGLTIGE